MSNHKLRKEKAISLLTILGIAIALSMDAFAVAVASGIALKKVTWRQTFRLSWHFGLFQALMPILGWSAGQAIYGFMQTIDHWIAFVFLTFIGAKMIWELRKSEETGKESYDPTRGWSLVILSVATSIDAFAVGLSMSLLGIRIWYPAVIIGHVTLGFTALGLHLGRWVHSAPRLSNYAQLLGGLILLAIGLNILWNHEVFG